MAREIQRMRELLQRMKDDPSGGFLFVKTLDMGESAEHDAHQLELLCDSGYARRQRDTYRITSKGYDFLL